MHIDDLNLHDRVHSFIKSAPKTGPKIVVGDIETFPALSYHFSFWGTNIGDDNTVEDSSLMSVAFKWLDQKDAFYADQRGKGKRMRDDRKLLENAHAILHHADMLVAHNGKKFDLRKLRAYMVLRGLGPFRPVRVIDTFQLNKSAFGFDKQSLKWTSGRLSYSEKLDHQNFPGFKLWRQCLADNMDAWDECKPYNLTDITSLEEMYLRVRGWYDNHPNLGPYMEPGEVHICPTCGSHDVQIHKKDRKTDVGIYDQYKCNDCGKYSRGRYIIRSKEQRAHILV